MVSMNNIIEGLIVEVIIIGISFLCFKLLPSIFVKKETNNKIKKFDFLGLGICLTIFCVLNVGYLISFDGTKTGFIVFFTLGAIGSFSFSKYVYDNQCPSCKKIIRAKKKTKDKLIKKFNRKRTYQPVKRYLYDDSEFWKDEPYGKEKTRTEHWETRQHLFKCNFCNHEWDSGHFEINTDEEIKPKIVKTNKKNPNSLY